MYVFWYESGAQMPEVNDQIVYSRVFTYLFYYSEYDSGYFWLIRVENSKFIEIRIFQKHNSLTLL